MPQAFSIIGAGVSALSNFLGNRKKNQYLDEQMKYQKYLRSLAQDPAKMSQYVQGFEKPLNAGLVKSVENQAQAYGAERGLSTSPQLMTEILAQALGPLQQNEQQMAINTAMQSLGLPSGTPDFAGTAQSPLDITSLLKNLFKPASATIGTAGSSAGSDLGGLDLSFSDPSISELLGSVTP